MDEETRLVVGGDGTAVAIIGPLRLALPRRGVELASAIGVVSRDRDPARSLNRLRNALSLDGVCVLLEQRASAEEESVRAVAARAGFGRCRALHLEGSLVLFVLAR